MKLNQMMKKTGQQWGTNTNNESKTYKVSFKESLLRAKSEKLFSLLLELAGCNNAGEADLESGPLPVPFLV